MAPGTMLMWDLIAITFSLMRMDLLGTIGGIISIIPFIGDIIGGIIRIGSKVGKYIKLYSDYERFKRKQKEAIKFGYHYGNKYNEIVDFASRYGKDGLSVITTVVKYGKDKLEPDLIRKMKKKDEQQLNRVIKLADISGTIGIKAAEFGLFLEEHGTPAIDKGRMERMRQTRDNVTKKVDYTIENYYH